MTDAPAAASSPAEPASSARWAALWATLIVLAMLARLGMLLVTNGTNDAFTWAEFGHYVNQHGLFVGYRDRDDLNHPPLPVYWSVMAHRIAVDSTHWPDRLAQLRHEFTAVFRLPAIAADGLVCWLLYLLWRGRVGRANAMAIAAAFAWSPCAILVSAYHVNTDSIMALLILLSARLAVDGKRPTLAGLALAGAINIKLTPLLLAPVLLLGSRRWGHLAKGVLGLAVGVIPFIPIFFICWARFKSQAISYRSNPESWGILYLLMQPGGPDYTPGDILTGPSLLVRAYYEHGRWLVLAAVAVWAITARRWCAAGRINAYDAFAVAVAIFMILAPGFGIQYIITALPLMFASRPRWAIAYGLAAGAFAAATYLGHMTDAWPIYSQFNGRLGPPVPWIGLAAWAILIGYVVAVLRTKAEKPRINTDKH